MEFCLLFMENEAELARPENPDDAPAYWGAWTAYIGAMSAAGVLVGGNGLQRPHTATRLSLVDGRRVVQDGPFADTKEQLGGYLVVNVPDRETAHEWAARSPAAAGGYVEVRPVLPPMPGA